MDDRVWAPDIDHGSARKRAHEGGTTGSYEHGVRSYQDEGDDTRLNATPYINAAAATAPEEESHTRSLLKGITWRCLATTTTVSIAWLVTGEVALAFQIGFVEFFAKIGIYYAHERIWSKIKI
jgi:adenylylsulfate kinase